MKKLSKVLAVALSLILVMGIFPITAWATEAESGTAVLNDTPYEGDLITGAGDKGVNHTTSIILVDESGQYPGGNITLDFKDVTNVWNKSVTVQEAYYKNGITFTVYLVAPGTFNVSSNLADGFTLCDTLSGKPFTKYSPTGNSAIVTLSIKSTNTAQGGQTVSGAGSNILNGNNVTANLDEVGKEAQSVYQELLDTVGFMATDGTWNQFLAFRGATLTETMYNNCLPEGMRPCAYSELTDFDKVIYLYTYVAFSVARERSMESWTNYIASPENFAQLYKNEFVNYINQGKGGNNSDVVISAFEKMWDWQYNYCAENNEPYNFISNCSYTQTGFGVAGSGTGNESTGNKEENPESTATPEPTPKAEEPGVWDGTLNILSKNLLTIGLLILAVCGLAVVLYKKHKENIGDDTPE